MRHVSLILAFIFGFISLGIITEYFKMIFGIDDYYDIPIALEGTIEFFDIKYQLIGQDIGSIIIAIVFFLLFSRFYSIYHRLKKRKKDTYDVNEINGPFILYLRSFAADATTKKRVSFADTLSEEEALVEALSDIAPVYAIGDPRDKKMPIGASRIYVDDEHWKSTVASMASRATLVALRLGKTDSFWWEVEMVLKSVPIDRILFIIPESKTFSELSLLYKILLEHNVDIQNVDVAIEANNRGSISSFVFFDTDGKPYTSQVKTGRFTQIFFKYTDAIRKSLAVLRAKYGLGSPKRTLRKARILQILFIVSVIFMGIITTLGHYLNLKYQRPYEILEKCVKDQSFAQKYSSDINGINLTYSIIEAQIGTISLSEEDYRTLLLIESKTMMQISASEFECIDATPYNQLLMVMKYAPNDYNTYVDILAKAALSSIRQPEYVDEQYNTYYSYAAYIKLPEWLEIALCELEQCQDKYYANKQFYTSIYNHINDPDLVFIQKVGFSSMYMDSLQLAQ